MQNVLFVLVGLCSTMSVSAAITVETVHVGNTGNVPDNTGYGEVPYEYRIGKYEVTAGQYTAFLNAVAADDINGLYDGQMVNTGGSFPPNVGSGITRSGAPGSYTYSVDTAFVNRPVTYVSFWNACRFANWLHNGQPTGAQDATTTEDGAYTLTPDGIANNAVTRNGNWTWAVTSENEWYKAAYHKNDGVTGNYFDYPTGSDSLPSNALVEPDPGNNANYVDNYTGPGLIYTLDSPYFVTEVGEFENSPSPYGTFDQGGNVFEWNETVDFYSGVLGRGWNGSSFQDSDFWLFAGNRIGAEPISETWYLGFRVVQIPEPSTSLLLLSSAIGMFIARRCKRHTSY